MKILIIAFLLYNDLYNRLIFNIATFDFKRNKLTFNVYKNKENICEIKSGKERKLVLHDQNEDLNLRIVFNEKRLETNLKFGLIHVNYEVAFKLKHKFDI